MNKIGSCQNGSVLPPLVGLDPKIAEIRNVIERVAASDVTVLITGETGTGKELVARLIHARSLRSRAPFVVVDCPSLPPSLFESEVFGHERGAYTGAVARHLGRLERADGGTLFLDEIGELPLELQPKLLRFLHNREVTRLGSSSTVCVDARVISATIRDLQAMALRDAFRLDLLYRLNAVHLELPPLRARRVDIALLVDHFMELHSAGLGVAKKTVAPDTLALLLDYAWPGNVRELDSVLQAALALTPGSTLTPESLARRVRESHDPGHAAGRASSFGKPTDEPLVAVLRQVEGNVSRAAEILRVHRATVYRRMLARGVSPAAWRRPPAT